MNTRLSYISPHLNLKPRIDSWRLRKVAWQPSSITHGYIILSPFHQSEAWLPLAVVSFLSTQTSGFMFLPSLVVGPVMGASTGRAWHRHWNHLWTAGPVMERQMNFASNPRFSWVFYFQGLAFSTYQISWAHPSEYVHEYVVVFRYIVLYSSFRWSHISAGWMKHSSSYRRK